LEIVFDGLRVFEAIHKAADYAASSETDAEKDDGDGLANDSAPDPLVQS
jgi:hypothetical protein